MSFLPQVRAAEISAALKPSVNHPIRTSLKIGLGSLGSGPPPTRLAIISLATSPAMRYVHAAGLVTVLVSIHVQATPCREPSCEQMRNMGRNINPDLPAPCPGGTGTRDGSKIELHVPYNAEDTGAVDFWCMSHCVCPAETHMQERSGGAA